MREIVEIQPFETPAPLFELPPSDVTLSADAVHVWFAVLDQTDGDLLQLRRTLSPDEQMRAERFHFQADRNRFIARHGILRKILGHYMRVEASELRFEQGKNGKPLVAAMPGKRPVYFNISHSRGVALFAFSRDHELGVDIEHVREIPEMEQIVEQFFSENEKAFVHALPEGMKRDAFFVLWTRKEALVKENGEGLSGLGDTLASGEEGWPVHTLRPSAGCVGALATKASRVMLRGFRWSATRAH